MADVRPFRALRYTGRADPALAIAPPYDVISPDHQRALYERSTYNVVRIEYGVERESDTAAGNRYTRASVELARWRAEGIVAVDDRPAVHRYEQRFSWNGTRFTRTAWFVALRLEAWQKGIVKPHEQTLAKPKADRLNLLRATRTQISPVYALFRERSASRAFDARGAPLYDFEADGQRHSLTAINDQDAIARFREMLTDSDVYIADGHHRYETALAYRDEVRARAASWTGEEPENFVLITLTAFDDPGLVVLPTHRLVHRDPPPDALRRLTRNFTVEPVARGVGVALEHLKRATAPSFVAIGLAADAPRLLELNDRAAVEALMSPDQPHAWKNLDVNVLQYGILRDVFGIDDDALAAGDGVTYTQDADAAQHAVASGKASCAFLLNATPVAQVLAVADAGGRMPQKSTYFYPKLPTGLVMRSLDVPA